MLLVIKRDLLDLLRREAEARPEHEICGILVGTAGARVEITETVQGANALSRPDRYLLDAASLLRADDLARRTQRSIVGFYHSHPDHLPIPSAEDRRTGWPDHVYVIITTRQGRAREICAWRYDPGQRVLPVLLDVAA